MARFKTVVRINEPQPDDDRHGITVSLSTDQAVAVLNALAADETLNINLVTNGKASEKFDYAS